MITLLFLHVLADFPLQNRYMSEQKCNNWTYMIIHCLVYGSLFYLWWVLEIYLLAIINHTILPKSDFYLAAILVLFLMASHYLIDYLLGCNGKHKGVCEPRKYTLEIDQLLHIFCLIVVWWVR